jgi:hypothetical protein
MVELFFLFFLLQGPFFGPLVIKNLDFKILFQVSPPTQGAGILLCPVGLVPACL